MKRTSILYHVQGRIAQLGMYATNPQNIYIEADSGVRLMLAVSFSRVIRNLYPDLQIMLTYGVCVNL